MATQAQAQQQAPNLPEKRGGAETKEFVYQVAGQDVKLNYNIVRNYLTKGNGNVSDQDILQFISICKYNQLNPFLNEAYLVKFGTSPAQMIVSKEAFFKRAEECKSYDGIQAGVIVQRGDVAVELEGCFYLPTDKLVGGWAKVYRSDRKFPFVSKVMLSEYNKGQSTWNEKPSTMISKVAKVQALREAFPTQLGAIYTADEKGIEDIGYVDVSDKIDKEKKENANKITITIDPEDTEKKPNQPKVADPAKEPSELFETQGTQPTPSTPGF